MTQVERVVAFLREHDGVLFTAKEIAAAIIQRHAEEYAPKRENPRFMDEHSFIAQVAAEIGAQKDALHRADVGISWQDRPKPRRYFWSAIESNPSCGASTTPSQVGEENDQEREVPSLSQDIRCLSEQDLYPVLMDYLKSELGLYCLRIRESRSRNCRGVGGNKWLHPDIVALQPLHREWDDLVRKCVQNSGSNRGRLWSFEVKKGLTASNVRESFFQTVSNSSWANEGYLVTTSIASAGGVEQELRILSALHGIGVIILVPDNPSEGEIFLPAIRRPEVDWQSVNRLLVENADFREFVDHVSEYFASGRLWERYWGWRNEY